MMRKILLLCLPLVLLIACAPAVPSDELILIGRLTHINETLYCGIIHTGSIAEYSDLQVLDGSYFKKTIYVVQGCPELKRSEYSKNGGDLESFRVGDYHLLYLTKQNIYRIEGFINDTRKGFPLYFCQRVDLYSK